MSILSVHQSTKRPSARVIFGTVALAGLLSGCDSFQGLNLPNLRGNAQAQGAAAATGSSKLVERDVEAPEVFSATDQGLWDGRPSLGGVWVAHPDVDEPERVIIRNDSNGKFVIGALFRRERDLPGPKLQISSDAAAALNILAGAPAPLNVTALRREEAPVKPEADATAQDATEIADAVASPAEVTETTLDPIAAAGAAIENAPATPTATAPEPAPQPAAAAPAPQPVSSLAKPFVQIGIFSVRANADRTAKQMRGAGLTTSIKQGETSGKPFWRVVVGPAANRAQLNSLLKKVKAEGFSDAYSVTN